MRFLLGHGNLIWPIDSDSKTPWIVYHCKPRVRHHSCKCLWNVIDKTPPVSDISKGVCHLVVIGAFDRCLAGT